MSSKFEDRVHAMACVLTANDPEASRTWEDIAGSSIDAVRAIDAALAECPEAQPAESADEAYNRGMLAGAAAERAQADINAGAEAYARGLAEGRANPWRPMAEPCNGTPRVVAWVNARGHLNVDHFSEEYEPRDGDIGWLPLPAVPR